MKKLLIISGPTATGKTTLGIELAKKFNGEIISSDSRQVYKGMDIVTGKDLPLESELRIKNKELRIDNNKLDVGYREKEGIPVWLVDVVFPNYPFNISDYHSVSYKVINDIWNRGKLPVVVGGSGLYIKSFVDLMSTMFIPPNHLLRKEVEGKNKEYLEDWLKKVDSYKWQSMNESDRNNPRRLIRAIEVAIWSFKNKALPARNLIEAESVLWLGLKVKKNKDLYSIIDKRVDQRLTMGALDEIKDILNKGYSWQLNSLNTCGVRDFKDYFEGKLTLKETAKLWKFHEHRYARVQMTWFKKDKRIIWFDVTDPQYSKKIEETARRWYTGN